MNYKKIQNIFEAGKELVATGLARSSKTAFLCEDIQFTYELLSTLSKDLLLMLETHLRNLIGLVTGDDHISVPLPPIEKYFQNPLYLASRKSNLPEVKELSLKITKLVDNEPTPKRHLIEIVLEQLRYLNGLQSDVKVMAKLSFVHKQIGSSQDAWLFSLIPSDFPAFLRINDASITLFTRLHHAFSFYTCENLMQELVQQRMKKLKFYDFRCYVLNKSDDISIFVPIYSDRLAVMETEEAFNLYVALERIREYRVSIEINYEVAKGIANIALKRFGISAFKDVEENISSFIFTYSNDKVSD